MRGILLALTLIALGAAQADAAGKAEFQLTPRVGLGHLHLATELFEDQDDFETGTFGLGIGVGVLTPVGVVLEAGYDSYGNFDLFGGTDHFIIEQEFASIGYQFELGQGWRIVPRVGRARWELERREGALFNPGPEESDTIRGYGYFWDASVSRRINRVLTLGMAYRHGNYDFGHASSTAFIMTLGW